jgi:hypothetical protein
MVTKTAPDTTEKSRVRRPTLAGDRDVSQRSKKAVGQPVRSTAKPSEEPTETNEYGVDLTTFVTAWESSDNPDEVYQKLVDFAKKANRQPMPKPIIIARAAKYRKNGVKLKKFKTGRPMPKTDVASANDLINRIRAAQGDIVLTASPNPQAAPPVIPEEYVKEAMKRLLGSGLVKLA